MASRFGPSTEQDLAPIPGQAYKDPIGIGSRRGAMFRLTINEKGGETRNETYEKDEITIGRVQGNDVILPKGNISKRHSRIVLKDGKYVIVDLKSTNGTYVNGKKITAPQVVKSTDKIYIGDFTVQIETEAAPLPDDAIDLFGGESQDEPKAAPGLIDDNFDQDFGLSPEPAEPAAPPPKAEPELEPMDLGDNGFAPEPPKHHDEIIASSFAPEPLGEPELAPEPMLEPDPVPEPAFEPDPDPEPPAAVSPASVSRPRPVSRTLGSRARPRPGPPSTADVQTSAESEGPMAAVASSIEPLDWDEIEVGLHRFVVEELSLADVPLVELPGRQTAAQTTARRHAFRLQRAGRIPAGEDVQALSERAAKLATDFGLVAEFVNDDAVVEVLITPEGQILVDRDGRLEEAGSDVPSAKRVDDLIRQFAVLAGIDGLDVGPTLDVRLRDGSRVVAARPPVSFRGPTLSIRKTTRDLFTLDKLVEYSAISSGIRSFVEDCLGLRRNILLSVGPGVSPTATLNALVSSMPVGDRLITIENGVELHLDPERLATALEPEPFGGLEALVEFALALQGDRLIVANLDDSAAEVLDAVAGPLQGSVVSLSASNPEEAIARIQDSVGEDRAARVAAAFPVVIQEDRFLDNSRRITRVSEVIFEDGRLRTEDIFLFRSEGLDSQGLVTGTFHATGYVPRFLEDMAARGEVQVNMSIFQG